MNNQPTEREFTEREFKVIHILGYSDYNEVWNLQKQIHQAVVQGEPDTLILTEHHHVITIGRSGGEDHFRTTPDKLKQLGYKIVYTNRGGDITYHGPGQLVSYPVFNLHHHYLDVHRYLRDLEEVGIRLLAHYKVDGHRIEGRTGIWTEKGKIAAIGVHVKKWVTMHGIAFNVKEDITGFSHIVPCGIADAGVTSLEAVTGMKIEMKEVAELMPVLFGEIFGLKL